MNATARRVRNTYLLLTLLIWLPTALIFGVNTLFLLDGGLNNVEAFAANAAYTAGLLVFELPTGVVADIYGRRVSFLVGVAVQIVGNALYWYMWDTHGPFAGWMLASIILGLGYTFFSGALEAWLVDALKASEFEGELDPIFGKAQMLNGIAMVGGSVLGGVIAQATNLGAPYLARLAIQIASFFIAWRFMQDIGWTPQRHQKVTAQVGHLARASVEYGLRRPAVRWAVLGGPFLMGTLIYAFYAAQPYLLQLWGTKSDIGLAGIAAAFIGLTQIAGGMLVPAVVKAFGRRTYVLIVATALGCTTLVLMGLIQHFWVVLALLLLWGISFSATTPVRQAYVNEQIPSQERATVLSFDSMVSSSGGVVFQPVLGRVADVNGYAASYVVTGAIAAFAVPFALLARRENAPSDVVRGTVAVEPASAVKAELTGEVKGST